MANSSSGIFFPTNEDTFGPAEDMERLAKSVPGVIVPVINQAGRDAYLSLREGEGRPAVAGDPAWVHRADTGQVEKHAGSGWSVFPVAISSARFRVTTGVSHDAGVDSKLPLAAKADVRGPDVFTLDATNRQVTVPSGLYLLVAVTHMEAGNYDVSIWASTTAVLGRSGKSTVRSNGLTVTRYLDATMVLSLQVRPDVTGNNSADAPTVPCTLVVTKLL